MHKTSWLAAAASLAMGCALAQDAPYAGQQSRDIKSLEPAQLKELLDGAGMGLAKAAELNGYPGPAHVLEHAQALALTPEQREASRTLRDDHKARARRLGAAIVAAERVLDTAFAKREIDPASLARMTAEIGTLQARLREEHLRTHLAQAALLTPHQVREYARLRGYADAAAPQGPPRHH